MTVQSHPSLPTAHPLHPKILLSYPLPTFPNPDCPWQCNSSGATLPLLGGLEDGFSLCRPVHILALAHPAPWHVCDRTGTCAGPENTQDYTLCYISISLFSPQLTIIQPYVLPEVAILKVIFYALTFSWILAIS